MRKNHLEAVDAYAAGIERDLGVKVTVHGYWLGGYTSDQVLDIIQSDEVLRAALSSADVIVFEVPIGEVRSECPWDNVEWHPLPGTPTEWSGCTARTAARNTANAGRIIDAIVALRSPADALILASNLWENGYRDSLARGIEPQMRDMFTAANAAVAAAAASHGIPVADAWTAFMGSDGRTDPVATGDLLDDMSHLTPQGAAKLAALWRGLGYEKGRTGSQPPGRVAGSCSFLVSRRRPSRHRRHGRGVTRGLRRLSFVGRTGAQRHRRSTRFPSHGGSRGERRRPAGFCRRPGPSRSIHSS